jgi:hypothetical protein
VCGIAVEGVESWSICRYKKHWILEERFPATTTSTTIITIKLTPKVRPYLQNTRLELWLTW